MPNPSDPSNPPDSLRSLRPEARARLDVVTATAALAVEPGLLDLLGMSTAHLVGNASARQRRAQAALDRGLPASKVEALGEHWASDEFTELERDVLAFAEQFVIDVAGVTDTHRDALRRHVAEPDLRAFATALYVTEFTQRLELMSARLLGDGSVIDADPDNVPAIEGVGDPGPALVQALRDYQDAVMRDSCLDPVVTEMVRLRCARTHNCRICQTLRLDSARSAGVDDEMTTKLDFFERSDLDERIKVALRVTDAFITRPDTLTDKAASDAAAAYAPDELASLLLTITKWSTQKIQVSLGTDGADALPKDASGLSYFDFAADGRVAGYSAVSAGHHLAPSISPLAREAQALARELLAAALRVRSAVDRATTGSTTGRDA
jgi:alkylhydroperoxidase family enzyme